ncbi:septum formation inhibitor Maf [Colwellia sp. D2M02]|uniref:Maf family protein n=1 Tax=Colwellia sp. D2M02 TaxID=2841562 RepID=UPI001C08B3F3|nr:Maf family protein [Colwellia sp. D2M02]MBU2891772.1 septum formation inhibitor Maf [Colwellia sp. D2M02]
MTDKKLVLASQSPRRQKLLAQLGYQFAIQISDIDESVQQSEQAADYVVRLATEKAEAVFSTLSSFTQAQSLVLGSDTCVVIDNAILGKPADLADCIHTLSLLSGKKHQVLTAIAVVAADKIVTKLVTTDVQFKVLSVAEMTAYWHTGEPQDKAGSYAIQGIGGQFVTSMTGSYSAVVGLPLYETAELLKTMGLPSAIQQN